MRCPRCNGNSLFEEYAYDKDKKKYVRKIYCPICYHREVMDITGEEPLEDIIEFRLQLYFNGLKESIIDCFKDGKIHHNGMQINHDGKRVDLNITIREVKNNDAGWL